MSFDVKVASTSPEQERQMPYIEGFVAAVPTANKDTYIEQAREAAEYFKKLGATRLVECWGDDVPKGEVTDFYKAVQAKDDEAVIFSWIEYPDKATRDAANEKMGEDTEMQGMEMPFDRKRMFWGGFEQVVERSFTTAGRGVPGNLRRVNPERDLFANFERMRREIDELFGDVFERTGFRGAGSRRRWTSTTPTTRRGRS